MPFVPLHLRKKLSKKQKDSNKQSIDQRANSNRRPQQRQRDNQAQHAKRTCKDVDRDTFLRKARRDRIRMEAAKTLVFYKM